MCDQVHGVAKGVKRCPVGAAAPASLLNVRQTSSNPSSCPAWFGIGPSTSGPAPVGGESGLGDDPVGERFDERKHVSVATACDAVRWGLTVEKSIRTQDPHLRVGGRQQE